MALFSQYALAAAAEALEDAAWRPEDDEGQAATVRCRRDKWQNLEGESWLMEG